MLVLKKTAHYDASKVVHETLSELASIEAGIEGNDWATLSTSRGLHAIVDKDLLAECRKHRWYAVIGRASHAYPVADIAGKRIALARFVFSLRNPKVALEDIKNVSFANKCAFDCRYANIEHRVGRTAAMRNRRRKSGSSSQYKGVRAKPRTGGGTAYSAGIADGKLRIGLGTYDSEFRAAQVYDAAAWILFEGAALLNVTSGVPKPDDIQIATHRISRARERQRQKGD